MLYTYAHYTYIHMHMYADIYFSFTGSRIYKKCRVSWLLQVFSDIVLHHVSSQITSQHGVVLPQQTDLTTTGYLGIQYIHCAKA